MKHYFYLSAYAGNFAHGCGICEMDKDDDETIKKNVEVWKRTNGYDKVFVYDMNHKLIGEY